MRLVTQKPQLFYVRLHLSIGVRYRISYIYFVASIHEIVIKTKGPEAALLLRV